MAPLLAEEEQPSTEQQHSAIAAAIHAASSLTGMDATPPASPLAGVDFIVEETMVNRILSKLVSIKTLADALPNLLQFVVKNGKFSSLIFLAMYLVLVLLWLPFWCMAYFITELGVYAFLVLTVFFIGRCIIRLLAFPGSSSRVAAEIETEFARYSVRMVQSSSSCVVDLCLAILASTSTSSNNNNGSNLAGYYDVPGLWARTKSYRDRVLGMYLDVLEYLYREPATASSASGGGDTSKYGNNIISGDIGDLSGLTVSIGVCDNDEAEMCVHAVCISHVIHSSTTSYT